MKFIEMKRSTKNTTYLLSILSLGLIMVNCKPNAKKDKEQIVEVSNALDFSRNEVVAIEKKDLADFLEGKSEKNIRIKKQGSDKALRIQWIDYDQDGNSDELLFQAQVGANATEKFVVVNDSTLQIPQSEVKTFSRFVPERIDDYTWENDKVAFRMYGPAAKQAALDGVPGGVISGGLDLWLKRTPKSIINKWYKGNTEQEGYYHTDTGEGYDPYHVGSSLGAGGIAVWENDSIHGSENYIKHNRIAKGPLRTVFELSYAPWSKYNIQETKRISLDLGSNFSKIENNLSSKKQVPDYVIGITLHDKKGETETNDDQGWFMHWETIDGSHIGEGIVVDPSTVDSSFVHKTDVKDKSHLLVEVKPTDKLTFYAGFAWERSGQIKTKEDWEAMLKKQVKIVNDPLKVSLK